MFNHPYPTVYGFFYCPCIHESADALMSLHATKRGAYVAMRAHKIAHYLECMSYDRYRGDTKRKFYKSEPYVEWSIKPVVVEP